MNVVLLLVLAASVSGQTCQSAYGGSCSQSLGCCTSPASQCLRHASSCNSDGSTATALCVAPGGYAPTPVVLSPCTNPNNPWIPALASAAASLSTLTGLLSSANLISSLKTSGPFTVFAPSNDAFTNAGLPSLTQAQLAYTLLYHVIPGNVFSTSLPLNTPVMVATLAGPDVTVLRTASGVTINGYAVVTTADLAACNGVVHIVDHVLIPPCGNVNSLPTLAELAAATPSLSQLNSLVVANPALASALSGNGSYTVFAPWNAAFATANVASLTFLQTESVILEHILSTRVLSTDLPNGVTVTPTTLDNQTLSVTRIGSTVTVQGPGNTSPATVQIANIETCNGVVHIIDEILLPLLQK